MCLHKHYINNMSTKILPFEIPITVCYPATSEASGILFTDEFISNWMYNCFIQVFQVEGNNAIDYYDFAIDNNPFLSYNEIQYSFIYHNWKSMKDFIRSCIKDNYYVRLFNNMEKNSLYSTRKNVQHDLLIYGYDDQEQKFYVADHFRDGKFEKKQCEYCELENAIDTFDQALFENNPAFLNSVQMIRKEDNMMRLRYSMYSADEMDYMLTLNVKRIINSLEDYLYCRPTTNWYTRGRIMDDSLAKSHKWGMDCYKILHSCLDNFGNGENLFLVQSFYVMYNHKLVMVERLKKINEFYVFNNLEEHLHNFVLLRNMMYKLMNMLFKMMYVKEKKNLALKMKDLISEIETLDYNYTSRLIMDLKDNVVNNKR